MDLVLHGIAKATHAIRAELQRSKASIASLANKYVINEKKNSAEVEQSTVGRGQTDGASGACSTALSSTEGLPSWPYAFRPGLPRGDVYAFLKHVISHLRRSSLHRGLKRPGISRFPRTDREKSEKFTKRCDPIEKIDKIDDVKFKNFTRDIIEKVQDMNYFKADALICSQTN